MTSKEEKMKNDMKMKHDMMSKLLDELMDCMPQEEPLVKIMKYSKKTRDKFGKIWEKVQKDVEERNFEEEKLERIGNFCEEMHKLIDEFMKQEEIEGV